MNNTEAEAAAMLAADQRAVASMMRSAFIANLSPGVIAGVVAVADAVDARMVDVTLPDSQAVRYGLLGQLCADPRNWVVASHPGHGAAFVRPPMQATLAFGLKVIHFHCWPGEKLADALAGDDYEIPEWVAERLRALYRHWCQAQRAKS